MEFDNNEAENIQNKLMFSKQLKLLIKQNDTSVVKVAKATKLNVKTLYNYLDGRSPRDLKHVKILCEHFKVSADFLLFGLNTGRSPSAEPLKSDELINFGNFDVFLRKVNK